jgi:hypothetical protein
MKLVPHQKTPAARRWIRAEAALQRKRYQEISHYINVTLAPKRARWYREFLERIQTRGYSVHFDQMRKIPPAELPQEPKRRDRVVW